MAVREGSWVGSLGQSSLAACAVQLVSMPMLGRAIDEEETDYLVVHFQEMNTRQSEKRGLARRWL